MSFEIAGRMVGDGSPTFIVAELSANHGHNIEQALKTIHAAAEAGADAIKLQTYTPDTLTLKSSAEPFVVRTKNEWAGRTLHDLYAEAMTPWEWHKQLMKAAEAAGLICFSTPFDPTAVAFLEDLKVPVHKIASFEIVDLPLVECVARTGKPVIISTGMATLGDIEAAVKVCHQAGNDRIALLRCVSAYPARPDAMNLMSFETLRGFGGVIGLSDHTRDATVAIASVALGAKIIEKHFILDRSLGGPDAFFSLEPAEFKEMVIAVRAAEAAMGPPRFGASQDEQASTFFRRSLLVARDFAAGETLTCDHVRSVRPAIGLHPRHLPFVLGRTASQSLKAGSPLTWEAVGPAALRPKIALRRATADDGDELLKWRNDEQTRTMSVSTAMVSVDEHKQWFSAALSSNDRAILIAEHAGTRVGVIRLDRRGPDEHEVSLTVAPEWRRKGLAAAMLVAVEEPARAMGARRLVAQLRCDNEPSSRAFKSAGYYAFTNRENAMQWCERRIVEFA